jgi:AraC family transcriptional regulator
MKVQTSMQYQQRLQRVIDYIYQHLSEDLTLEQLAEQAWMSPWHFHRTYRLLAEEPVNMTVRRLRLQSAAGQLLRSELSLLQIARQLRYSSAEALSRAFRKQYGVSPQLYKQQHRHQLTADASVEEFKNMMLQPSAQPDLQAYPIEIQPFDTTSLIGLPHQGDYLGIGQTFDKLAMLAGAAGLLGPHSRFFGLYYDDPLTVPAKDLRALACVSVPADTKLNPSQPGAGQLQYLTLPQGTTVSLLFQGDYAQLEQPYNWLFGQWLPHSGEELADFPPFEEYLNDVKDTPPAELLTQMRCYLKR